MTYSYEYLELPMERLRKSPGNKRPDNVTLARLIGSGFDDFLFGSIDCAARDGWYYVIDGWTRKLGAEIAGRARVRAQVVHGYSEADDARAFVRLNTDRTATTAAQRFWGGIDYGDPVPSSALRVCRDVGIEVLPVTPAGATSGTSAKRANATRAYGALETAVRLHGPEVLREALQIIRAVWPDDPKALESAHVSAVVNFIALYERHPHWSSTHFAEALKPVAVVVITQRINAYNSVMGTRTASAKNRYGPPAPRAVLLDIYNRRLRRRTLPEATASIFKRISLGQNPWSES